VLTLIIDDLLTTLTEGLYLFSNALFDHSKETPHGEDERCRIDRRRRATEWRRGREPSKAFLLM
jgi:hypothetical protein